MKKRILAIALAILMLLPVVPMSVSAAGETAVKLTALEGWGGSGGSGYSKLVDGKNQSMIFHNGL